jgi:hypothetical protein
MRILARAVCLGHRDHRGNEPVGIPFRFRDE